MGIHGEVSLIAKPAPPHIVVLGDARMTINAIPAQVFEALTNPERLAAWWGQDARVDAQVGGVYETTLAVGRVEGTITAIDGARKLIFAWPIPQEEATVVTTVAYELNPRGPQTAIHVVQHSPKMLPGDWNDLWRSVLEALKAYLEAVEPTAV
ncbi:MAG: SRPBCC family protein [Thermoplasmata archaeon]